MDDPDGPDLADPGPDIMKGLLEKNHLGGKFSRDHKQRWVETVGYHVYYYEYSGSKRLLKGQFDLRHVESISPLEEVAEINFAGADAVVLVIGNKNSYRKVDQESLASSGRSEGDSPGTPIFEGAKTITIGFLNKAERPAWLALWTSAVPPFIVAEPLKKYIVPATSRLLVAKYMGHMPEIKPFRSTRNTLLSSTPKVQSPGRYSTPTGYRQDIKDRRQLARTAKEAAEKAAAIKIAEDDWRRREAERHFRELEAARLAAEEEARREMDERTRRAAEEAAAFAAAEAVEVARLEEEARARVEAEAREALELEVRANVEREMMAKLAAAEAVMQAKLEAAEQARVQAEVNLAAAAAAAEKEAAEQAERQLAAEQMEEERRRREERAAVLAAAAHEAKVAAQRAAADMKTAEKATKTWTKMVEERAARAAAKAAAEEAERAKGGFLDGLFCCNGRPSKSKLPTPPPPRAFSSTYSPGGSSARSDFNSSMA